uniref:Anaphase-promoting complex subunit 13 n=2 Tax=Globodera pallida TaxID=36090 RepID=A0A183BY30_GLOPA
MLADKCLFIRVAEIDGWERTDGSVGAHSNGEQQQHQQQQAELVWDTNSLSKDDIAIPPKEIPDQDSELNYLLEADESRWQDQRPPNFCFEHRHR